MKTSNHPEYTLRLRVPADATDQDGTRRLRAALKRLLRSYGLRCIAVEPAIPLSNAPAPVSVRPFPGAGDGQPNPPKGPWKNGPLP